MIAGIDRRTFVAPAVIAFLGAVACAGQGNAQTIINEKGAWQIAAPADADTAQVKFSLSTLALDQSGAKFSLSCRKDVPLYYFAIKDGGLASSSPEDAARFSVRVTNHDPIWFQTGWRDGGIEVREGAHQTAFSIIMMMLTEANPTTVEFSFDSDQKAFSLDGFADLMAKLRRHCGHDLGPEREPPPVRRGR
jgi:hypothetical protein